MMKMLPSLRRLVVLLLFLLPLLTVSCGTLEIGIERTSTSGVTAPTAVALATEDADLATAMALATQTAIRETSPPLTPTLIPASTKLRVAFVKVTEHGNNAWLWTEGEGDAVPLTKDGGVGIVKISDDGEIVAFTRGDGLWMIRSNGTEERELLSAEDLAAMEPRESFDGFEVMLNRFEWVPGTHILAFNTRLQMEIGLVLNDDLHMVNADTGERALLLPPGKGGEFYYSPDGHQVAVVTPGTISLMNTDGSNRREVFTYTPVSTRSEVQFYAKPVWAADSGSLRVAIPPVDPFADPSPQISVWNIPTDGTPAGLIGNIATGQTGIESFIISPDLRYIAHLYYEQSDPASFPVSSLLITDLDNNQTVVYYPEAGSGAQIALDSGETITHYPEADLIYGWAPDSQHFAFLANFPELPPKAQIGQLGGDVIPVYDDADAIIDVQWVDADQYLFLAQGSRGWSIVLGEMGGPVKAVASVGGSRLPPIYDFAAPATSTSLSSAATPVPTMPVPSNSGDSPIPFGLIYQTTDGLWHVNANGESAQIFDRPGAVPSPDSTQIVYDEANDIWLADVATGEQRNLTQTPDRVECCAQWWPGQPATILFNSWTKESEGPNSGFPTVARLDGSGYQVLDESQGAYASPAPSPDGQTVAYDRAGQPRLYRPGTGSEPFDLTPYGLSNDSYKSVVSPAWSPDGRQIAWIVGGCDQWSCQYDVGVFDLEAQTVQFVHPHEPVGRGGQPPAPTWSPDGRWLAFNAWAMSADDAGLWVVQVDGQQEEKYRLDADIRADHNPTWSPDGRWLAFGSTPQGVGSGLWLSEAETWNLHSLDLPPDAYLVDWVSSPGN